MTPFPIPAPAFKGNSRVVSAGSAFEWLRYGWFMFLVIPGRWVVLTACLLVIQLCLTLIPWLGTLLVCVSVPFVGAGLLFYCQQIASDEAPRFADFLAGFRSEENTKHLLGLGAFYALASWIVFRIVAFFGWGRLAGYGAMPDPAGFTAVLGGVFLAMLFLLVLSIPLLMALWFAPALVVFNKMPALEALKASFEACLKNAFPLLTFGLIVMVLAVFAALPAGLGVLVLFPVLIGANYASYRDVFVAN